MTMKNWFTLWFGRDMEVHGFELPTDPTDDDRALAARVTREFPRLRASEASTDYIEPATWPVAVPVALPAGDDAVATTRLYVVTPASAWFEDRP